MIELLIILSILVGGSATANLLGVKGFGLPAIGFILGLSIYVTIGSLLVMSSMPNAVLIALSLTLLIPAAIWLDWQLRNKSASLSIMGCLAVLLIVAAYVVVFNTLHLVSWHVDSFAYIENSILIFTDQYGDSGSIFGGMMKRLLAGPLLLALGQLAGGHYLPSLMPLLATSGILSAIWLLSQGLGRSVDKRGLYVGGALMALIAMTNTRFLFHSTYLNAHLFTGATILLVVGVGWLLSIKSFTSSHRRLLILQALLVPALVFSRAEGGILAAVSLLPTLLLPNVAWRLRSLPLASLGLSLLTWNGYLLLQHTSRGSAPGIEVLGLFSAGLVALISIPALKLKWISIKRRLLLHLSESALWLSLVMLFLVKPDILVKSVKATIVNQIYDGGSWGLSLVLLALVILFIMWLKQSSEPIELRFPLTTFTPLMLLIAYLREGGYRIGDGDSLNRAWMHILLLAVLYVAVLSLSGTVSSANKKPSSVQASRTPPKEKIPPTT